MIQEKLIAEELTPKEMKQLLVVNIVNSKVI